MSLSEIANGPGNLTQRISPIDNGREFPGGEKLTQDTQIGLVQASQEKHHPLAHRW
jgi:hypothetical protein